MYDHLTRRAQAIQPHRKDLRRWSETNLMTDLLKTLDSFAPIHDYMEAVQGQFAADLSMLHLQAMCCNAATDTGSIADAMVVF